MPEPIEPVEPIPPERARAILDAAIRERLGEDWDDEQTGWVRISGHDYMARLARGRITLDFYVDLLGHVTVEKSTENTPGEAIRLALFILLALSLVIALLIVRIVSGG
ncbi:MAG: hypothetical protein HXY41_00225 [Chloroflexi bacterium]|nr:hypothetical protein [Chloroflexota bacterium]